MRVPIFAFDLIPKRRFKHIAKVLRRHWPGANAISLMTAQEILAQGLGYRDLHDVLRSSENCSPDAPVPTLAEVRDNVSTSIFQFLKSSNAVGIDDRDIERLVLLLPLHELSAFHSFRQEQTPYVGKTDSHSSVVRSDHKIPEAAQRVVHKAFNSTGSVHWKSASPLASTKYLSRCELDTIEKVVQSKANLRDQFLCSVLLSDIRQSELLHLKVENVNYTDQMVMLDFPATKLRLYRQRRALTTAKDFVVSTYVKESGLAHGDYLFPSSKNTSHPMTSYELNKILHSWLLEAQIDPTEVSTRTVRRSVIFLYIKYLGEQTKSPMPNLTDLSPSKLLGHYSSSRGTKPKA